MFIRLLRGPQPSNILLIVLFSSLLWLKLFMIRDVPEQVFFAPFLNVLKLYISPEPAMFSRVIVFGLVVFEAFYIIRLNVRYIFIDKRTFFPAMVYILWVTLMFGSKFFHASIIANFFILIAFEQVLQLKQGSLNIKTVFNVGLLVGIASMFYWPSVTLLVAFWFISLIIHGINWRGLFAQLLGVLVPWFFVFIVYYLKGDNQIYTILNQKLLVERTMDFGTDVGDIRIYIMVFLLSLSLMYYFSHVIDKKIIIRKYFSGLFWFLIVIVTTLLAVPSAGQSSIILSAIPASFFLSNQYLRTRTLFFAEFFFTLLVAAAVIWVVLL